MDWGEGLGERGGLGGEEAGLGDDKRLDLLQLRMGFLSRHLHTRRIPCAVLSHLWGAAAINIVSHKWSMVLPQTPAPSDSGVSHSVASESEESSDLRDAPPRAIPLMCPAGLGSVAPVPLLASPIRAFTFAITPSSPAYKCGYFVFRLSPY